MRAHAPTVSVGMPVYNGERYLQSALDSLLAQTYEDFEILISDNASSDATQEISRAAVARDSRVRYVRNDENRGVGFNFSRVVRDTTGPYFKWAAADDVVAPTFLERCVKVLDEASEQVVLVFPQAQVIDAHGALVRDHEAQLHLREHEPHERLRHLIRTIVVSNELFGLIRRSALERTRLMDVFLTADYVLLAELALAGEFWQVSEPLFSRREHPGASRRANRTAAAYAEFYNPGSGRSATGEERYMREFTRVGWEMFKSINSAVLPLPERMACSAVLVREWGWRHGARMLSELVRREYTGSWNPFAAPPASKQ
jgi:glycosyltransferase involved in cell wall biosynthesis